ncbi:MAG: hypothetical protein UV53_C0015G0007 [Candidatus Azambacteria bacterium GW2011_GWE1_42_9]|nr:MAG: hypothetical protein UU33_C0001G0397 [Candidatus Azambacteria bacterium GW2011_GWF1_41_10]KKS49431.1 MAG: hypothetical protein UV14_C0001G0177 [Candidatus Azambacteria bacterium GW2011_GWF2_42_22]KKS79091.1 MAG: hypothetical protein UV53_C0015G0007 [Candidatus Azambacteria bacterium GW2011_GWE1_42_9]KKT03542.1 MAG: hypothetical protein UV81_C0001G0138 [Candidatus Azambacteria bacterium GW2011_GWD1_43_18]KKT12570.1 MAG: hypothetical protein UV93_C0003G0132 [Candidatus Azambacteria bacter
MKKIRSLKIKKVLGKYNYWRRSLKISFLPKRRMRVTRSTCSACQVACYSDPCQADPTCDFD